jgi:DNA-binding transcriptional MerR regulator
VLRFWETRFPELKPLQRGGNRRYYRPADVAFASALHKLLHQDGYTVKGVRKLISDHGAGNLAAIANGEPAPRRGRAAASAAALAAEPPEVPESASPGLGASPAPAPAVGLDLAGLRQMRDRLAAALAG